MAFSFSGLSSYTKQLVKPLLTSAVTEAKTQQMIMSSGIVIPNAKSVVAIPIIDTDANFQTQGCSFDASGTTTFSQRTITVGKIKIEEKLCPTDLQTYFLQESMKQGANFDETFSPDIVKAYLDKKNMRIASQIETALWQGDTTSASMNLNKFDGLGKLIKNGSSIDANVSGYTGIATITAGITAANVIAATEGIYKAIPAAVMAKGDVKIFVGVEWYRLLILAYREKNMFSYNPQDSNAASFILPATNVEVVCVNGLNSTNEAYAISLSNMALAVDLEADETSYKFWWNENDDDVRFRCKFNIGCNVAFVTECVRFKATA